MQPPRVAPVSRHSAGFLGSIALAAVLVVSAASASSLLFLHQSISKRVKQSLVFVLDNNFSSLQRWETEQQKELKFWANTPDLAQQFQALEQAWQARQSLNQPLQAHVRKQLQSLYRNGEHEGFYLINRDGVILSADQPALWGTRHPLWQAPGVATALQTPGDALMRIIPLQQPGYSGGHHLFSAAVIGTAQTPSSGVLIVKLNPDKVLKPLLERARYLNTGRNYLFDRQGPLWGEARESLPLIGQPQKRVEPIRIKDKVLWRAWIWEPRLQVGLVTEAEEQEAMAVYYFIRTLLLILTLLAIGLLLVLSGVYHHLRRRAESLQAYTEQERDRARRYLEAAANLMVVLDFNGHIQQINRQARLFLGNPAQVVGLPLSDFLRPDEQHNFQVHLQQLSTGEIEQLEGEQAFTTPQGDTHYFLWSTALLDATAPQSGYIISGQDISLRRQAEQALQELNQALEQRIEERTQALRNSEAMFRAITLGAQDGIILLNPVQEIVLANEAAEDILGFRQETLLGQSFFQILADENTVLRCERDEPQRLHEVWIQHAQGHTLPIEMTLSPFRLQEEEYIVAILRDISERKQMVEAIAQANDQLAAQVEQLQELINEKSEFLGIASHDLKNPLGVVAGVGRLLQRKATELKPEDAQQYGEMVQRAAEKMLAIVVNLLDVQRLEEGQVQLQSAPFQVLELAQELAATYAQTLAEKGQRLVLEIPPEQTLHSDRHIVGQILDNLISNAMKYAPPDTVITLRSSGQDPIEMQIRDQGPGFSEADRTRLFQKFARLSARPTGGEHSTGLGLAIVKRLTLLLGGDIRLSDSGPGACFVLTLPQQPLNRA